MIDGLRFRHLFWWSISLLVLTMTATADQNYSLNWTVVTGSWSTLQQGWNGLWDKSKELAVSLDSQAAARYGVSEGEKRLNDCVTIPAHNVELPVSELGKILEDKPQNRDQMIATIGLPVCQSVTGEDKWLVEGNQTFNASYGPVETQLRDASKKDSEK